jgi:hypothetical protein
MLGLQAVFSLTLPMQRDDRLSFPFARVIGPINDRYQVVSVNGLRVGHQAQKTPSRPLPLQRS